MTKTDELKDRILTVLAGHKEYDEETIATLVDASWVRAENQLAEGRLMAPYGVAARCHGSSY